MTTINVGPEAGNGLGPSNVAVNQRLNKVYVVNELTGNISVIDGSTNLVEATIGLEQNVLLSFDLIEVNPATNMVYVAGTISSIEEVDNGDFIATKETYITVITVIDGITNNIVETISINNASASGLAVNPNTNVIYVTGNTELNGIIGVIDGESNKLVDIVSLENIIVGKIAVNSGSNTAYIISNSGGRLSNDSIKVLDGEDNTILDTITIRNALFSDIDVNPDTNMIYLTDFLKSNVVKVISGAYNRVTGSIVRVINGANNRVIHSIEIDDVNLSGITVDPIANTIYVIGQPISNLAEGSRLAIIDGSKGSVTDTIKIPDAELLTHIAVNPNTLQLYTTAPYSNNVYVINAINIQDVNVVDTGVMLGDLVINPDTNRIYVVSDFTNSLNIIDSLTNEVIDKVAFPLNTHLTRIAINPDTSTIYVAGSFHTATFTGSIIHVIDGSSNQIIDSIMLRNMHLNSLAVNLNTNTIYAGATTHSRFRSRSVIKVINGSTNRIADTIIVPTGSRNSRLFAIPLLIGIHIIVNANTNTIYVYTEDLFPDSNLTVVNGTNNRIVGTIPQMGLIENIAVNINTNMVYVAALSETVDPVSTTVVRNINVVDGATRQIVDSFLLDETLDETLICEVASAFPAPVSISIAVNSNTNKIYVSDADNNEVKIIDGANNEILETFTVGKTPVDIAVNRSNNLVYVSNQISGNITVIQE